MLVNGHVVCSYPKNMRIHLINALLMSYVFLLAHLNIQQISSLRLRAYAQAQCSTQLNLPPHKFLFVIDAI